MAKLKSRGNSKPCRICQPRQRPLLAQHLAKINVKVVIAGEFGPGASAMLEEHGIRMLRIAPGELVVNALKNNSLIK